MQFEWLEGYNKVADNSMVFSSGLVIFMILFSRISIDAISIIVYGFTVLTKRLCTRRKALLPVALREVMRKV